MSERFCPECDTELDSGVLSSPDPGMDGDAFFACPDPECGWDSESGEIPDDFW